MVLLKIVFIAGCVLMIAAVIVAQIASRSFDNTFRQKVAKLFGSPMPNLCYPLYA